MSGEFPMTGRLTFLVGGARSGKSTLALRLAEAADSAGQPVTFIVTAVPFDDDMLERVRRHREERPSHWTTVESPVDVATALAEVPLDHFVVVDCLTVFLANLLVGGDLATSPDEQTEALVAALQRRRFEGGSTVVVSNEVGLGIHPDTELGRVYRDDLGRLNQAVAAISDRALLMVAGRAISLSDPMEYLQ
jgi:adenosyl cobinamide kinase/adenosyl cobinamide phosphate guanylyltransferase